MTVRYRIYPFSIFWVNSAQSETLADNQKNYLTSEGKQENVYRIKLRDGQGEIINHDLLINMFNENQF